MKALMLEFFLIKLQVSDCDFIKKETLTQVIFYEFCKIFESIFFYRTFPMDASVALYPRKQRLT